MASFASVNHHPPFAYDPSCKPTKSILKQKNRLSRTPSSWLSNINSKLQTASLNLSPDGLNEQQQLQQQRPQTETGTSRPLGLFRKFINNQSNVSDNSSIASGGSNEQQSTTNNNSSILDIDELAPEELKRVRFSVGQLTTEYYPYRQRQSSYNSSSSNSSSNDGFQATIGSDDDEAPSTASSCDAPELPDHATAALLLPAGNKERHPSAVPPPTSQKKTPKQVLELYEHACANKEEMPLPSFVASIHASQDLTQLTRVDFSGQALSRRMLEPLADVLGYVHDLRELSFANCGLEDDALKVVLHALLLNDTLCHLNLAENKNLKTTGFKYIAIYVKGTSKLEHLDLSMTIPDKKAIQYLAQAITSPTSATAPSIKTLLLDGCVLKPPMLEALASGVRKSSCLRHLSLVNCKINHQGAIWLGVMLRDYDTDDTANIGLHCLNLDNNEIRQGVQYIAQALRRNISLNTLTMRDCKLDSKGCAFIGEALRYNQSLMKLAIGLNSLNQPTSEGVMAIKQALYSNRSLSDLDLSETGSGSEAAVALAECLPENRTLRRLDLSRNVGIDLAGLMALLASMRLNHTLAFLDLTVPPYDREMIRIQSDIVAKCTTNTRSPSPTAANDNNKQTIQANGTRSISVDSRVTASTTARLTLQERLAAVTRGKSASSSSTSTHAAINGDTSKQSTPPPKPARPATAKSTPVKKKGIDADTITTTMHQVELFEEMLTAEASQRDEMVDTPRSPEEVILQVFGQCQKSQAKISSHIPRVTDPDQLAQLLELNDRLTAAIARYQRFFTNSEKKGEEQVNLNSDNDNNTHDTPMKKEEENSMASSLLVIKTEPPLSTSFEIGDVDDEEDELVPIKHPSSPAMTTSNKN
ncbi:RNI-like protein [Lichtheimia hyalospora FSU 10163]|nr:RNI-like protein [Lichtheimia hyalospora FSU 10163]